ncbi:A/G-specific adenine glycosylase [Parerythrobacter jejuensis]|uniref:Adenine DNA glycosylase n=1 Tax=Parerythrobacter jejuensis TaxID=795812 RepID=A0A845AT99_9SPHN|nr:A/G-specific adenine glycosylase [Parerythrobacter jejuensis]MXP32824.1 A/G-specific adenine glycosylase [Parerythrobacter jejuensis]
MTASDNAISTELLDWYDRHARDLPWRAAPGQPAPDPYRVWLSEIMLQQTTVAAVKPYFAKFLHIWPTVEALAAAPDDQIMAAWAGLGYYSRARNLAKAARVVAELGAFPETEAELRKLPGVGDYTAAAIAAIAFGERAVVVDANVERVVSRLFAIEEPLPKSRKVIRTHTDAITPECRAGDFAQAMMDLGSSVCTSRSPQCLLCPLSRHCEARMAEPEHFPFKAPKKEKPIRAGQAYWIEREQSVWLVTREGTGMLGGMRALPDDGWSAKGDGSSIPPFDGEWAEAGSVSHSFTHFSLDLSVMVTRTEQEPAIKGEWWPLDRLEQAGLPTLFAKAARRVLAG